MVEKEDFTIMALVIFIVAIVCMGFGVALFMGWIN